MAVYTLYLTRENLDLRQCRRPDAVLFLDARTLKQGVAMAN
jgi:hypothetical protein